MRFPLWSHLAIVYSGGLRKAFFLGHGCHTDGNAARNVALTAA